MNTFTLYRPVGLREWELIEEWGEFPPRFETQPIFYPVLNQEYAAEIARKWNTKDRASSYIGIVTRFEIDLLYADKFDKKLVGNKTHEEMWVPAKELEEFNDHIIGSIEAVEVFYGEKYEGPEIEVKE